MVKTASNAGDLGFIPEWKDPPEKGIVTHSSILAWRIPWTREHGGLRSLGLQRHPQDSAINTFTLIRGNNLKKKKKERKQWKQDGERVGRPGVHLSPCIY